MRYRYFFVSSEKDEEEEKEKEGEERDGDIGEIGIGTEGKKVNGPVILIFIHI